MPASMISAPTGGRPNVIGSSIATVAMVPMPGSTPTSVPTRAPIRHSRRLIGVKATPKPRARLEKSSAITPSLNQETREKLQRQPQRIRKEQTAADRQANADNDGFLPFRFRRAQRGDDETRECRNHQAQRADGDRKGKNRQRYEQRASPRIGRNMLTVGHKTDDRHRDAKSKQENREHAGRGSGSERKSMHALQVARRPQGEQCDCNQSQSADKILRTANPFRHDVFDRPTARRLTHRSHSPAQGFAPILCSDMADAFPRALPSDFRQITPAKPKQPPASNSQSGLSRVAKASAAATAVTRAPAQVRSAVSVRIRPLAPINPIESGTSAA